MEVFVWVEKLNQSSFEEALQISLYLLKKRVVFLFSVGFPKNIINYDL